MKTIQAKPFVMLAAAILLGGLQRAEADQHPQARSASAAVTPSQVALREAMRKLWSDHVFWTREYVVAAIDGPEGVAQAAAGRLMKNQEDIGNAVAVYYGTPAGSRLTALLKEHIQIAVELVSAAKAADQPKVQQASARWTQNADAIAAFLSQANPNWPRQALVDAMRMHLDTTTKEVTARLHKDYAADVAAFDAVYQHILHMSDVLADGIVKQFPDRFAG
jgi:hypothetical protein